MDSQARALLGHRVFARGPNACTDEIIAWVRSRGGLRWLACLNPHSHVVAGYRESFAAALSAADWLVPDGVGISIAARCLGVALDARVTGSEVFEGVSQKLNMSGGGRVVFVGSTPETLATIQVRYEAEFPGLKVVGLISPPFKDAFSDAEYDQWVSEVNECRADILWVGMTAPKQEEWICRLATRLDVRFAGAIGAVFDFYAGRIQRSSPLFRRLGLEWLPRLLREPRRLWRRNGNSLVFALQVAGRVLNRLIVAKDVAD